MDTAIASAPVIVLQTGDTLVVPTDGAEETMSLGGREFDQERMLNFVRTNRKKSAAQIVKALFRAARDFADGRPQDTRSLHLLSKYYRNVSLKNAETGSKGRKEAWPNGKNGSGND